MKNNKEDRIAFRATDDDREKLEALAKTFHRNMSETVRLLIARSYRDLNVGSDAFVPPCQFCDGTGKQG